MELKECIHVQLNLFSLSSSEHHYSNTSASPETVECGVLADGNERINLAYKGTKYSRGDFPWAAAIFKIEKSNINIICGGTLVSDRHVVTGEFKSPLLCPRLSSSSLCLCSSCLMLVAYFHCISRKLSDGALFILLYLVAIPPQGSFKEQ